MKEELKKIEGEALKAIDRAENEENLDEVRIQYLGKKGVLTKILRDMGKVDPAERPAVGRAANELKERLQNKMEERKEVIDGEQEGKQYDLESIDVTLTGRPVSIGSKHLLTTTMDEMKEIFLGLGFSVDQFPDIESDYYCFEALNMPKDHPARDMQDSYFINPEIVLRTHTTAMDVRVMEKYYPEYPIKVVVPGRCYRRDDDLRHSPMFHQIDGIAIDERITLGDLKGTLLSFAEQMFGGELEIRLRPSFFPFTQPSAEVDILCVVCGGDGCRLCSQTGWLEILGSGIIHPKVLERGGYDPEEVSGFAFGMGVERIAMLKYGVDNIRHFFTNDKRFLEQF